MPVQAYIGRQPILDRQQKIIGYELLFRNSREATSAQFGDEIFVGATILVNTLSNMGAAWLLGDKLAFINISTALLESDFLELLPAERVVLEIVETVRPTPELLARCRKLRAKSFRFALDDFELTTATAPFLEVASFIKLDIRELGQEKTVAMINALDGHHHKAKLIAEKVETKDEFRFCRQLGFSYFQGYYFAHPETLSAKTINPAYANVLSLLDRVREKAEIQEIETYFKKDVALSFKLLRYINSAGFGLSCEIESIRHALAILGYKQLYRWLTLLLVTAGEGTTAPALTKTAITRGRLTELLGAGFLEDHEGDNLFIVGVFSLLDVILEMPMEQVLEKLYLPAPINDALLHRQGIYAPFLQLAEACEDANLEKIEKLAGTLQLAPDQINRSHLAALAWVEALGV
jgi:EAL and modified HD-GYP domain-containing signal transduction protein